MPPYVPPLRKLGSNAADTAGSSRPQSRPADLDDATAATRVQALHRGRISRNNTVKLPDMIDQWLARPSTGPPCSLVVWDFDKTVLRIHAFGRRIEPEQVAARWERDIADKDLFIQFVTTARSRGIHVGIASFGRAEVVQAYMHEIFREHGGPVFSPDLIVTPTALGARDGTSVFDGKPRMLQLLSSRCSPPVTDQAKVLFFDDDGDNIADCVRAGYRAVHTPAAFTRAALKELAARHLAATGTELRKQQSNDSLEGAAQAAPSPHLGARGGFLPPDALKQAPSPPLKAPPVPPLKAPDAPLAPARLAELHHRFGERQKPVPRRLCDACFQPVATVSAQPALHVRRNSFNSAIAASAGPGGMALGGLPSRSEHHGGPEIAM